MTSIAFGLALGFVLVVIGLVRMAASRIDGFFASISCDVGSEGCDELLPRPRTDGGKTASGSSTMPSLFDFEQEAA